MANADPEFDKNREDLQELQDSSDEVDVFVENNSIVQPGTNVDISNDSSDTGTASQGVVVSKLDDLLRNSTDHHREFIERFDNIDMRMQLLEDRIQRQDETLNKLFGVIELLGEEDTGTYFV
tara:strand:- start:83 stop:448 length:366 start_codon:yes stop_codon:yes gene_type:complete